ncbi:hypothetical protein EXIGLDRAFT_727902 [Exidia glandulosa HHB12029]|uniref:F-box domain-containing protein n=1 Tax=Exidia glandulosa HHB12029 TaxID=1314781 RepID=A0A165D605_EXIGL|nr:hypothetical protein EXIGLDRAFT_727902 [Exidia glandulosa HHB12029]
MSTPPITAPTELPAELLRRIIEQAAREAQLDDLEWMAQSLAIVCRDVHSWILPILYHTLALNGLFDASLSRETFQPAPYMAHVRCLMLMGASNRAYALHPDILAAFPHVHTFAINRVSLRRLGLVCDFAPSRLIYFSRSDRLFRDRHASQTLRHVTHLRVDAYDSWTVEIARLLPSLSHLFLDYIEKVGGWPQVGVVEDHLRTVLLCHPNCTRIVLQFHDRVDSFEDTPVVSLLRAESNVRDPRIHVYRSPVQTNAQASRWRMFKACARDVRAEGDIWEAGVPLFTGDAE